MGIFSSMWNTAYDLNKKNILHLVESSGTDSFCDLGCDDGKWTMEIAKSANAKKLFGIELVASQAKVAESNGIQVSISNLNNPFPFEDNRFDLVHANQVIEHIADIDVFVQEIRRILKVGGNAIISTENASSWHNIFASVLGWQIFSLTNVSAKVSGIGNPLATHRGEQLEWSTWTHKTIFNYLGLIEFFKVYGFAVEAIKGAGYYPLPAFFGNLDVRHSHFITLKVKKTA